MKILFFASYPTLTIGYSRIANRLTNYLAEQGHTIYYVGISKFENTTIDRYVHPNIHMIDALKEEAKKGSDEKYGVNIICDKIIEYQPDIVFIYNDIIVITRILNNFNDRNMEKNFNLIIYFDLVYPYEKKYLIDHVNRHADLLLVFSDCWKENLIQMKIEPEKIKVLPHGFDSEMFFHVNQNEARKHFNFNPEDFIVLNTNRNAYRKQIDKTIDAFIQFLKIKNCDKRIKLFLNLDMGDKVDPHYGCNIFNQIEISCLKYNVDHSEVINHHIFRNSNEHYSDEMLNYLYNACDVGINTCIGEGFGLCNLEHGGLGKPQIMSGVGALVDIFKSDYSTLIEPIEEYYISNVNDFHGGYAKICLTSDFVEAMIRYFDDKELAKSHGEKSSKIILEKYNWDNILKEFNNIITEAGKKMEIKVSVT